MTKLPEKNILDGSKLPKTTTGEMKDALGKLRDYLNELLGEDSTDKEAARLALGIDLAELAGKIEAKADQNAIEAAIQDKADKTGLESVKQTLEEEIRKKGVPIGSIDWLAVTAPPVGYLIANGAAVGRETYPDLYAAIGTTYGEGDGTSTFNLPNLIGRFAEGSATPGVVKEAGLPNITGSFSAKQNNLADQVSGAFSRVTGSGYPHVSGLIANCCNSVDFDAALSNSLYGASDTVQPPALTLLPCIKAFDATVNSGLIDVTELAQEVANKTDSIAAAHAAMPSGQYVDLSLVSGSAYTAPADGFFTLQGWSANGYSLGLYVWDSSVTLMKANNCAKMGTSASDLEGATVTVSKGDKVYAYLSGTVTVFRFVYANGSQP